MESRPSDSPAAAGDAAAGAAPSARVGGANSVRRWRGFAVLAAGLAVLIAGSAWLYGQLTHVRIDDARVAADVIATSSRVPGRVTAVNIVEGESISAGAVLVTIDDRETKLLIQELEARISGIGTRRAEIEARITMIDRQTQSQARGAQARIAGANAAATAAFAKRDFAFRDFARVKDLVQSGAISRQQWDQARMGADTAQQEATGAEANVEAAKAELAQAEAARKELAVLRRQLASLGPEGQQLKAQLDRALLDLRDRTITMPFDGTIDKVFVHASEYVTPGQRLLMLHNPRRVRVEANVKETEIRYLQPGQRVEVTADAYPDRTFDGTVERISGAATSEFALLPNPNPSGNFTKITQRLPIRIAVHEQGELLKPGMMVEVLAKK